MVSPESTSSKHREQGGRLPGWAVSQLQGLLWYHKVMFTKLATIGFKNISSESQCCSKNPYSMSYTVYVQQLLHASVHECICRNNKTRLLFKKINKQMNSHPPLNNGLEHMDGG